MIGAIAGDIIGSVYEFHNICNENFPLFSSKSTFTDDTVLTVATADTILDENSYSQYYLDYAQAFPNRGYGGSFIRVVTSGKLRPYNSFGNGSAMRVSPVGWVYNTEEETLLQAKKSAEVTHNHPEGIKGAQAVALTIFLARTGKDKKDIKKAVSNLGYDLSRSANDFGSKFDVTCQGTIPRSMAIFLETDDYQKIYRS